MNISNIWCGFFLSLYVGACEVEANRFIFMCAEKDGTSFEHYYGKYVLIHFHTDESVTYNGWRIGLYTAGCKKCFSLKTISHLIAFQSMKWRCHNNLITQCIFFAKLMIEPMVLLYMHAHSFPFNIETSILDSITM